MNFKVIPTPTFAKSLKALAKRYRSMKADMDAFRKSLEEDPFQGTELTPGVRKIRMAITSKGGGKSGGARVITKKLLKTTCKRTAFLAQIWVFFKIFRGEGQALAARAVALPLSVC